MRRATIAVEDRRFYRHSGVDYEGIARALWRDVTEGELVEGGSTLTQQLVRNLYISRERTVGRKLREACLAIQLNRKWSKQRILRSWLNTVYFGNRSYGIEAASQTYFSKHARQLNLREAALLAGLPQAPSAYDPFVVPDVALARRNTVLRSMLDNGDITREAVPMGCRQLRSPAEAGRALHDDPRAVLLRLRPRRADRSLRREHRAVGRAQGLHDHQPALPARRGDLDPGDARPARRSGFGRRLDQPRQRRHSRDDVGHPRPQGLPVQPRCPGAAAGRLDVQDLRAGDSGDEEDRPLVDALRLGAVHVPAGPETSRRGRCRRTTTPTPAGRRSRARPSAPTTPSSRS